MERDDVIRDFLRAHHAAERERPALAQEISDYFSKLHAQEEKVRSQLLAKELAEELKGAIGGELPKEPANGAGKGAAVFVAPKRAGKSPNTIGQNDENPWLGPIDVISADDLNRAALDDKPH